MYWVAAQPIKELAAQLRAVGGRNAGVIGDLSHLSGSGDHTPWSSDGPPGVVKAIDIGDGGAIALNPVDMAENFLVPRLRARYSGGPVLHPEVKYILTNYHLWDTRAPWNMRQQVGGDGPDHLHISVLASAVNAHSTIVSDYLAWRAAGRPNPVTFRVSKSLAPYRTVYSLDATFYVPGRAPVFGLPKRPWPIPGSTVDARRVPADVLGRNVKLWDGSGRADPLVAEWVRYYYALMNIPQWITGRVGSIAAHYGMADNGYFSAAYVQAARYYAVAHNLPRTSDSFRRGMVDEPLWAILQGQTRG